MNDLGIHSRLRDAAKAEGARWLVPETIPAPACGRRMAEEAAELACPTLRERGLEPAAGADQEGMQER